MGHSCISRSGMGVQCHSVLATESPPDISSLQGFIRRDAGWRQDGRAEPSGGTGAIWRHLGALGGTGNTLERLEGTGSHWWGHWKGLVWTGRCWGSAGRGWAGLRGTEQGSASTQGIVVGPQISPALPHSWQASHAAGSCQASPCSPCLQLSLLHRGASSWRKHAAGPGLASPGEGHCPRAPEQAAHVVPVTPHHVGRMLWSA